MFESESFLFKVRNRIQLVPTRAHTRLLFIILLCVHSARVKLPKMQHGAEPTYFRRAYAETREEETKRKSQQKSSARNTRLFAKMVNPRDRLDV